MYLLDTNVVSELRKPRPHGGVLAWLQGVDDKALFLSAVTVGEIQAGIELTREQDASKAAEICPGIAALVRQGRATRQAALTQIRSALKRFTEQLLTVIQPGISDLVIETWRNGHDGR